MNAIKGVGEAAVEDIIAEREANGPYATVYDFITRVNQRTVNKKSLESLILAGAMDSFKELHRAQYFYMPPTDPVSGLERLVRFGNQVQASTSMASNSLFGEEVMPDIKPPTIPECEPWGLPELLDREKEVVGIYLSAHPMDGYKFEVDHYGFSPISEIEKMKGRTIRIAGYVTDAAHMTTKKGSKFGKMVLNDYTGNQEIVFWEANYVQYSNYIDNGQKLIITGVYQEHRFRPGVMEFQIQGISLLDQVRKTMTKRLHIHMPLDKVDELVSQFLYENIKQYPGNAEVLLAVTDPESGLSVKLRPGGSSKVELNDALIQFITQSDFVEYKVELNT